MGREKWGGEKAEDAKRENQLHRPTLDIMLVCVWSGERGRGVGKQRLQNNPE